MQEPSELDLAGARHYFRQMYRQAGYDFMLQQFYEGLIGAKILAEVMAEERAKEIENG